MALDSNGNLYIADTGNDLIRKVSSSGVITTVAGGGKSNKKDSFGDGGPATSASLNTPLGVALDSNGNLYIADTGNDLIRKVSSSGVITTVAGGSKGNQKDSVGDGNPATSASLNAPYGLALDSSGNLYIADAGNARIRKVNSSGVITTIAGTGEAGYSGDGGPAATPV